jgi:hypothetical protein
MLEPDMNDRRQTRTQEVTLEEALEGFLRSLNGRNRSQATIAAYRADVEQFISWFRKTNALKIQASMPDPDFDAVKWTLAQNCYVAKAIGLDPTGFILSKDVFGNSVLYLDTNVLMEAMEPTSPQTPAAQVTPSVDATPVQ